MHSLIEKLFAKRGIEDVSKLKPEEKANIDRWQKILSEGEMTVEKIASFCRSQIKKIDLTFRDRKIPESHKAGLIPYHSVYTVLLEVISAPQPEKENLEKYLNSLIDGV